MRRKKKRKTNGEDRERQPDSRPPSLPHLRRLAAEILSVNDNIVKYLHRLPPLVLLPPSYLFIYAQLVAAGPPEQLTAPQEQPDNHTHRQRQRGGEVGGRLEEDEAGLFLAAGARLKQPQHLCTSWDPTLVFCFFLLISLLLLPAFHISASRSITHSLKSSFSF